MVEDSTLKFVSPVWLWGILVLPIFYAVLLMDEKRRQAQFSRFAGKKLWSSISPEMDMTHRVRKGRLWLLALGFSFLALARPQYGSHEETVQVSGLDIMLALDVSNSMDVADVVPSRLQKAKHLARSIVTRLQGDRVGAVAFAASSYVACPLTSDLSYLWDTVQILGPKMIQSQGTDVGMGLETAFKSLERGAQEVNAPTQSGVLPSRIVILISDGEDHENQAMKIAAKFKETGTKLYILGVGTAKGGPVPVKDDKDNVVGYKRNRSGDPIVSTFRPEFLKELSDAAGGKYWSATIGESEVEEILNDMGAMVRTDYAERHYLVYEDRYQIPLFIAVILFLLELSIPSRKLAICLLFFISPLARAAGLDTYLENQKGIRAYQEGKIEEAQKNFGAAQARDPTRPELEFNQGVVQLQQGATDQAIEAFQGSARSAMGKQDKTLLGKSFYNLGNAYTKKGDVKNAVRSYVEAIRSAIESKNPVLENEARKNLQLLIDPPKEQQQQEQQQQKQQKEQEENKGQEKSKNKENDKKDSSSNSKDEKKESKGAQDQKSKDEKNKQGQSQSPEHEQDQEQGKDESRPYKESLKNSRNQKFESKKMKPEDADRVMSELTTRERALQEKLQTQHAKSQNNPKDW